MDRLFKVFEKDDIPATQGGYLNKCISPLISKCPFEVWKYLEGHPRVVSNLLKHLDNGNVAEILTQCLVANSHMKERKRVLKRVMVMVQHK